MLVQWVEICRWLNRALTEAINSLNVSLMRANSILKMVLAWIGGNLISLKWLAHLILRICKSLTVLSWYILGSCPRWNSWTLLSWRVHSLALNSPAYICLLIWLLKLDLLMRVLTWSAECVDQPFLSMDHKPWALLLLKVFWRCNQGLTLHLTVLKNLPMRSGIRILRLTRHPIWRHVTSVLVICLMSWINLLLYSTTLEFLGLKDPMLVVVVYRFTIIGDWYLAIRIWIQNWVVDRALFFLTLSLVLSVQVHLIIVLRGVNSILIVV